MLFEGGPRLVKNMYCKLQGINKTFPKSITAMLREESYKVLNQNQQRQK